jgi:copper chaperone CopZ
VMKTQQSEYLADEVSCRIEIPLLARDVDAMVVEQAIMTLPGIANVAVDIARHRLMVRYDAAQLEYQAIIKALDSVGFPPTHGWSSRIRESLYQFRDTNARDNAKTPPPPCCNKPPK